MFGFWKKPVAVAQDKPRRSVFSTHAERIEPSFAIGEVLGALKRAQPVFHGEFAMDDSSDGYPAFKGFASAPTNMSDVLDVVRLSGLHRAPALRHPGPALADQQSLRHARRRCHPQGL